MMECSKYLLFLFMTGWFEFRAADNQYVCWMWEKYTIAQMESNANEDKTQNSRLGHNQ
jgi:hypothetical protein